LGDTICAIKTAWLFANAYPCSKYLLTLHPRHDLNFLWDKFCDTYHVERIYDTFDDGNMDQRFAAWDEWRTTRKINGIGFDLYRELYRRIDGANRQTVLCGTEHGLGRKNIFEYFYYGQESAVHPCIGGDSFDGDALFYHPPLRPTRDVYLAPKAKCQGNRTFTFDYWSKVVHKLLDEGLTVTVNHDEAFCEDCNGHPNYRRIFPSMRDLQAEIARHKITTCGNTGVGWMAATCNAPLLAMQPIDSFFQDYRYEWCGVKSLVEIIDEPDADYCVARLVEECQKMLVFTAGVYDVLHSGHLKHLEESKSLGTRLVVGINSDRAVKERKGPDRPHQKADDRAAVLRGCKYVDEVVIFDDASPLALIQELRPQIITCGPDYKPDAVVGKEFVESYGGRVVITGGERTVTSSQTIQRIAKANTMAKAIVDIPRLTPNPPQKLKLAGDQLVSVLSLEGAIADVGCYRGAYGLLFKRLAPARHVHLFDTFEGNPHTDPLCHHKAGEWVAELGEVKRNVGDDSYTHFHKGLIQDTAANTGPFCFVFVDCDTYQGTRAAIELFWPQLVPGGKMVFDDAIDWLPCAGVEKAIDEAFQLDKQQRFMPEHAVVVTK
jgi:rfaE bifunctional protein nucleotidyltransferase chain/domain